MKLYYLLLLPVPQDLRGEGVSHPTEEGVRAVAAGVDCLGMTASKLETCLVGACALRALTGARRAYHTGTAVQAYVASSALAPCPGAPCPAGACLVQTWIVGACLKEACPAEASPGEACLGDPCLGGLGAGPSVPGDSWPPWKPSWPPGACHVGARKPDVGSCAVASWTGSSTAAACCRPSVPSAAGWRDGAACCVVHYSPFLGASLGAEGQLVPHRASHLDFVQVAWRWSNWTLKCCFRSGLASREPQRIGAWNSGACWGMGLA